MDSDSHTNQPASQEQTEEKGGGFDCEFEESPPQNVQSECPVCLLIIREPYQVTCCGKKFCLSCIQHVQTSKKPCPTCKSEQISRFPDKGLKQTLYGFKVHCSHQKDGCEWTGELGQLDGHLNTDPQPEKQLDECQFVEISCIYCDKKMQRQEVQAHQTEQCDKCPISCEYCHKYEFNSEDMKQNHWPMCGSFPLHCPNECGLELQRQNVDSHVADECPLTTISCNFLHVDCAVKLPRKDMPEHLRENLLTHISLLATSHAKQQAEITKQQNEITQQRVEISEQKEEIQKLIAENETLKTVSAKMESNHQLVRTSIANLQAQMTSENQALRADGAQLKKELELICEKLKGTHLDPAPRTTIPLGCPILTMTNFKEHKKSVDAWYSPPVYTHSQGYKICLGVYANVPNRYISVFIHFMRGEFDHSLKWPFRGVIAFQLLDQLKRKEQRSHRVVYDDSVEERVCSRVTERERAEKGWGKPMFMAHAELEPKYLHTNTLVFQIYRIELA